MKMVRAIVRPEKETDKIIKIIADTGRTGSFGDGKVFLTDVSQSFTVRTGEAEL